MGRTDFQRGLPIFPAIPADGLAEDTPLFPGASSQ